MKPIEFFATATVAENARVDLLITLIDQLIKRHAVDMYVFEKTGDKTKVRSAGYHLDDDTILDEKTPLGEYSLNITQKLWFKIDDYGDKYIGTFLYPSEY